MNKRHKNLKSSLTKVILFCLLIVSFLIQSAVVTSPIGQINDEIAISVNEIKEYNQSSPIKCNIVKDNGFSFLKFKLFDILPIKTVKANILRDEKVYLGGHPIGITIGADGVIIVGKSDVITDKGLKNPTKGSNIFVGDVLLKLDGKTINSTKDVRDILNNLNRETVSATIRRKNNVFETTFSPVRDALTKDKKLGLFVKDDISGVGTMTFINKNYQYGALGHNVSDTFTGSNVGKIYGNIFNCKVVGYEKGMRGKAGELVGYFNRVKPQGTIRTTCDYGIYGTTNREFVQNKNLITLGSRFSAKIGKAQIYTTINGTEPKYYDIEIIKMNFQKSKTQKGMVIRVVDKELLNTTGGIVQGMSGSPIIQNNKLIGAVTHVFLNDPTKGYGLYIDWMKDN